jgi:Ser/Thr protein kinase RdoA (MazF antagonist)
MATPAPRASRRRGPTTDLLHHRVPTRWFCKAVLVDGALLEVLAIWGIKDAQSICVAASGTMNDTWLVNRAAGRVVLRRHRRTDRDDVELEHRVLRHAKFAGIPAPSTLNTPGGEEVVEHAGRLHSLYSWAPGRQVRRASIGHDRAFAMGSMLARIHLGLEDLAGSRHESVEPEEFLAA